MAGTMNQTCALCFYFDKVNLLCRHDPPVVIMVTGNKPSYFWPTVAPTDWCGEFQSRNPPGS